MIENEVLQLKRQGSEIAQIAAQRAMNNNALQIKTKNSTAVA